MNATTPNGGGGDGIFGGAAAAPAYDGTGVAVDARLTQYGNTQRLVARYGHDIRYCTKYEKWFVWDGRRWVESDENRLGRFAIDTIHRIMQEIPNRGRPATDEEHKRDSMIRAWSIQSEKIAEIKATVQGATFISDVQVEPTEFDANPWLLNVKNGTVDLRTGKLHPHSRPDFITKIASTAARCTRWEQFLDEIFA